MSKSPKKNVRVVVIERPPIELSKLLKFAELAGSGGEAKYAIREGQVRVNGAVETRKGKKLVAGDEVSFGGESVVVQAG